MSTVESVDEVPELTEEEEAGIQAAIESIARGKGVSLEDARTAVDAILGR